MEQNAGRIHAQGLGVAAISYDSVAVLRQFADRAHIGFPLLSDPDSSVIRRYGILNETVAKDSAAFGIPNPGTYLVDRRGIVTANFFHEDYRVRDTAASISLRQFGLKAPKEEAIDAKHATLRAWVSGGELRPGQRVTLSLDVALPRRVHVYAPGVRGYKPVALKLSESRAFQPDAPAYPNSKTVRLAAIQQTVPVYDGQFRLLQTITLGSAQHVEPLLDEDWQLAIEGQFLYQACDDRQCFVPETVPLRWVLKVSPCLPSLVSDDGLESSIKSITEAYAIVRDNAAEPVSAEQAYFQGAIPGMLRRLDPHSVFFDPDQFEQLKKLPTLTDKGFGSVVRVLPGRVVMLQTLPGTPSAKSGMVPGDEILAVNGYQLSHLDIEQIIALLTQSRQQQAQLVVRRPGNARFLNFVLTPEEIQTPSVERAFFLKPGIGYLHVSSFDEKTGRLIRDAIEKLGGRNLKGLVLDLRKNPGGLVTPALETAALFLKPGARIVTVRGRSVAGKSVEVPAGATPYEFPLAVLIDDKTASASEILAGALQDHDRAAIVGEASLGEGLVQSIYPLSEGTGLALTTALYYTPSGRSIQRPLDSSQFALAAATAHPNGQSEFHTDGGRKLTGGGGIVPDYVVVPPVVTRLRAVLEASGAFTTFATGYVADHRIAEDFEVTPALLDDFQVVLSQHAIQPGVNEWSAEREFIANRLKTEIFNLTLGVEKGDEVAAQRDPPILKALEVLH